MLRLFRVLLVVISLWASDMSTGTLATQPTTTMTLNPHRVECFGSVMSSPVSIEVDISLAVQQRPMQVVIFRDCTFQSTVSIAFTGVGISRREQEEPVRNTAAPTNVPTPLPPSGNRVSPTASPTRSASTTSEFSKTVPLPPPPPGFEFIDTSGPQDQEDALLLVRSSLDLFVFISGCTFENGITLSAESTSIPDPYAQEPLDYQTEQHYRLQDPSKLLQRLQRLRPWLSMDVSIAASTIIASTLEVRELNLHGSRLRLEKESKLENSGIHYDYVSLNDTDVSVVGASVDRGGLVMSNMSSHNRSSVNVENCTFRPYVQNGVSIDAVSSLAPLRPSSLAPEGTPLSTITNAASSEHDAAGVIVLLEHARTWATASISFESNKLLASMDILSSTLVTTNVSAQPARFDGFGFILMKGMSDILDGGTICISHNEMWVLPMDDGIDKLNNYSAAGGGAGAELTFSPLIALEERSGAFHGSSLSIVGNRMLPSFNGSLNTGLISPIAALSTAVSTTTFIQSKEIRRHFNVLPEQSIVTGILEIRDNDFWGVLNLTVEFPTISLINNSQIVSAAHALDNGPNSITVAIAEWNTSAPYVWENDNQLVDPPGGIRQSGVCHFVQDTDFTLSMLWPRRFNVSDCNRGNAYSTCEGSYGLQCSATDYGCGGAPFVRPSFNLSLTNMTDTDIALGEEHNLQTSFFVELSVSSNSYFECTNLVSSLFQTIKTIETVWKHFPEFYTKWNTLIKVHSCAPNVLSFAIGPNYDYRLEEPQLQFPISFVSNAFLGNTHIPVKFEETVTLIKDRPPPRTQTITATNTLEMTETASESELYVLESFPSSMHSPDINNNEQVAVDIYFEVIGKLYFDVNATNVELSSAAGHSLNTTLGRFFSCLEVTLDTNGTYRPPDGYFQHLDHFWAPQHFTVHNASVIMYSMPKLSSYFSEKDETIMFTFSESCFYPIPRKFQPIRFTIRAPPPLEVPQWVRDLSYWVGLGSGLVSGFLAPLASHVSIAPRFATIERLRSCEFNASSELPFWKHPMTLNVFDGHDQYHTSAMLLNMATCASLLALHFFVSHLYVEKTQVPAIDGFGTFRFPSVSLIFVHYLQHTSIVSTIVVLVDHTHWEHYAGAVGSVFFWLALFVMGIVAMVKRNKLGTPVFWEDLNQPIMPLRDMLYGRGEWRCTTPPSEHRGFVKMFASVFSCYREDRWWFFTIEVCATVFFSCVEGFIFKNTGDDCKVLTIVNASGSLLFFALLIALRPIRVGYHMLYTIIAGLIHTLASVFLVFFSVNPRRFEYFHFFADVAITAGFFSLGLKLLVDFLIMALDHFCNFRNGPIELWRRDKIALERSKHNDGLSLLQAAMMPSSTRAATHLPLLDGSGCLVPPNHYPLLGHDDLKSLPSQSYPSYALGSSAMGSQRQGSPQVPQPLSQGELQRRIEVLDAHSFWDDAPQGPKKDNVDAGASNVSASTQKDLSPPSWLSLEPQDGSAMHAVNVQPGKSPHTTLSEETPLPSNTSAVTTTIEPTLQPSREMLTSRRKNVKQQQRREVDYDGDANDPPAPFATHQYHARRRQHERAAVAYPHPPRQYSSSDDHQGGRASALAQNVPQDHRHVQKRYRCRADLAERSRRHHSGSRQRRRQLARTTQKAPPLAFNDPLFSSAPPTNGGSPPLQGSGAFTQEMYDDL